MPARSRSNARHYEYSVFLGALLLLGWLAIITGIPSTAAPKVLPPLLLVVGAHVLNGMAALAVGVELLATVFRGTAPEHLSHQDWCCALLAGATSLLLCPSELT